MRRIAVTVAIVAAWLVAVAAPASAHTVSGVAATNYRTTITGVSPQVSGVSVKVIEEGSRLELTNTSGTEVVVLGYQGEPYLRVGPSGVFENQRSPATYVNRNRKGNTPIPAEASSASPDAAPRWKQISTGTTARWHDHRIHWMGGQDPPQVKRAPGRYHLIFDKWTVNLRQGSRPIAVTGQLAWVPGPSALPWALVAVVLFALAVVAGLRGRWTLTIPLLVGVLVAVDVVHALGVGLASAGGIGTQLGKVVAGSFFSLFAWAAATVGIVALARRNTDGLFAVIFAAVVIALFGGLNDLSDLFRSQVPFAWSDDLARVTVVMSLGLGLGLVAACVLVLRRVAPRPEPAVAATGP